MTTFFINRGPFMLLFYINNMVRTLSVCSACVYVSRVQYIPPHTHTHACLVYTQVLYAHFNLDLSPKATLRYTLSSLVSIYSYF